jgi:hypothetical protein
MTPATYEFVALAALYAAHALVLSVAFSIGSDAARGSALRLARFDYARDAGLSVRSVSVNGRRRS